MGEEIIKRACCLDLEPLSNEDITTIVKKYADDADLVRKIQEPDAYLDFGTKFIKTHEEYISLSSSSVGEHGMIRTCHNLPKDGGSLGPNDEMFLCIHGLGGTLEQFEPLMRLLDYQHKKFLALDLPGFGKSDEWEDYPMIKVAQTIHEISLLLFKRFQESQTITIVGHSAGCYLALHLLSFCCHKYKIEKLVLLSPPKHVIDPLSKKNRWTQYALKAGYNFPWILDFYRVWIDQRKGLSSSGIQQYFYREGDITNQYRRLWQFHNNVQIKSRSLFGYLLGWEAIDWSNLEATLLNSYQNEVSILVVCGDKDVITPLDDAKDMLKHFSPIKEKKLIILPECGHNLTFDCPELLLESLYEGILT